MAMLRLALGLAAVLPACSGSSSVAADASAAADAAAAALDVDDECLAGDAGAAQCALNAIQLRGQRVVASDDESLRLKAMGRAGVQAALAGNSSAGFGAASGAAEAPRPLTGTAGRCLAASRSDYTLSWKAQGKTFFDDFTFMTVDETHGATEYASKQAAVAKGLAYADDLHAIIRTGASSLEYKRKSVNIHTNYAWDPQQPFLVVLKYDHMPHGCGVWPGFWAMNSDRVWPAGGELDILEYANSEPNKVTFHVDKGCRLDQNQLNACMRGAGVGGPGPTDCATDYFKNLFGCRPQQKQHTGDWYASQPGVLAAEWTSSHIKVFHIPKAKIPADLANDAPQPGAWDDFLIAHLPFDGPCNVGPQELVLNLQLCGDWAGNAWDKSTCPQRTGLSSASGRCSNDIWNPPMDCCTQYAMSAAGDAAFRKDAFFDISYLKVYTAGDAATARRLSGTYTRGGVPLT